MRLRLKILSVLFTLAFTAHAQMQIEPGPTGPANIIGEETEAPEPPTDPEINRVISIVNQVDEKNNFIEQLGNDTIASLPFGLIKQIGVARYIIAIDSMEFKKEGAYLSAYAALDFPGSLKKLAFKASNIKFNPSGVVGGEQAKLYLASNHLIKINSQVSLKLLANGQNWVEWDCNGFKAINLTGNFIFRKTKLVPANGDTAVTASFQIYTKDLNEFVANVSITPFKISGLKDWTFNVTNATVDMSAKLNSQTMVFPNNYPLDNFPNPNMWTGFSLQELKIKLPSEISKPGRRTEITVNNMLIDQMGFSGSFQVNNLFSSEEGTMNGWDFSIEELGVGFLCNNISGGKIKGSIEIPITSKEQKFQYTADAAYNYPKQALEFNFLINPAKSVRFEVFSADVELNNNSTISVAKVNGYYKPTANLHGKISFDHHKCNSNGGQLLFQNLLLTTDAPYLKGGIFSLHNINGNQTKSSLYPVVIDDITFGITGGAPILGFHVGLNFSEYIHNNLTVGTSILFKGKIEPKEQFYQSEVAKQGITFTKTTWSLDKVTMSGVNVDIETAPFTLKGMIEYKENVPIYGTGFFGLLDLQIKKVLEDPIAVSVGFGNKEDYRYFFLDTKIPARFIIPSTPIGLSRIIGGLYYHMKPNKNTEGEFINLTNSFNTINGNALTYVPDKNTFVGFKAGVTGEFVLNESVFNGDFLLDVNFNTNGGLGLVSLGGNMYSMATIAKRNNAPIKGTINMIYDYNNKTFDAEANVDMSYYSVLSGSGKLKFHSDPLNWYLCAGKPSAPNTVRFLNLAEAPSYFMTGNDIEAAMSPPDAVTNAIGNNFSSRNQNDLAKGKGFCAGARITSFLGSHFNAGFFNIKGYFNFALGFDLMAIDYGDGAYCSSNNEKVGINGRQAEGNMYLHMNGGVEIYGSLKIPGNCPTTSENHTLCGEKHCCCIIVKWPCVINDSFNYTVFSTQVNAFISAKVPSPTYFNGYLNCEYNILNTVKGSFNYNYKYGDNCASITN